MIPVLINVLIPVASFGVGWLLKHFHAKAQVKTIVNATFDTASQTAKELGHANVADAISKLKQT